MTEPFYSDWKFWSVVVSAVAIVLSQLPPLHILLRRAKLDVEAYSRMHLTHRIGNPNAQLHLIISNRGGRELKIKSITLRLRRGTDAGFTLAGQNYLQFPADKESVLLTSFRLKPKEEWAHLVNFLNFYDRQEQKTYKQAESKLRQNIGEKRTALEKDAPPVTADDEYIQPLMRIFESKFSWHPGEYELTLEIQAEPKKASVSERYRITIFESDTKELRDYSDGYKYGWGVFLDAPGTGGIILPLTKA